MSKTLASLLVMNTTTKWGSEFTATKRSHQFVAGILLLYPHHPFQAAVREKHINSDPNNPGITPIIFS